MLAEAWEVDDMHTCMRAQDSLLTFHITFRMFPAIAHMKACKRKLHGIIQSDLN